MRWLAPLALVAAPQASAAQATPLPPVVYRSPGSFPNAPASIRQALEARQCLIPVVPSWSQPQGLVRGQFDGKDAADWAAMCATGGDSSVILVFWEGRAEAPDTAYARGRPVRILRRASVEHMRAYELGCCGPEAAARLTHDGLEEFSSSSYSSIHYWNGRSWEVVQGAD